MFDLARSDRQMKNFSEMATRLGIDLADLSRENLGYTVRTAIRTCRGCQAGEVCRDWLARAAPRFPQAPAFCPNAELFARFRSERPALAATSSDAA